jgi:hypothetical protein
VLLDGWVMETSEYESFVQWLPREMIEDVISLLTDGGEDEIESEEESSEEESEDDSDDGED